MVRASLHACFLYINDKRSDETGRCWSNKLRFTAGKRRIEILCYIPPGRFARIEGRRPNFPTLNLVCFALLRCIGSCQAQAEPENPDASVLRGGVPRAPLPLEEIQRLAATSQPFGLNEMRLSLNETKGVSFTFNLG